VSRTFQTALVFLVVLAALPKQAHAYLDPATGSMLLQLVLGGVAGLALLFKLFWYRILGLFGSKKHRDAGSAE